jgi:3-deoxy-D-manno-octulosonic-acid transferase
MTRFLYALAWLIAAPLIPVRLWWRGRKQPGYRARVGERFGRYGRDETRGGPPGSGTRGGPHETVPRIWIHAVSVGETRAAVPLVDAFAASHPGHRILLTHMTPTGWATGEEVFGDRVERAWLPYDLGFATRAFVRHWRPEIGVILETEIWPRLLQACADAGVPVALANARLSPRSARRYGRFPGLARWAFRNLALVAAQTEDDARRFSGLGARAVSVTGNVKFDLEVPGDIAERGAHLRSLLGAARPVWVAGSTREGEEALLLDALAGVPPGVLLVIVPRHPQRFDEVAALARARGLEPARRSAGQAVQGTTRVVVGDTMGEMLAYYAAADVVLMGGSFLEYGSQNLIEACALGRPVIIGRHTYNFEQAAEGAIDAGAAVRVEDAGAAMKVALEITRDAARRNAMGENARAFVQAHRGAAARLMERLEAMRSGREIGPRPNAAQGRPPG